MIKSLIKILCFLLVINCILLLNKDVEKDVAREEVAPHVVPWRSLIHNNKRLATGFHLKFFNKTYIITNRHVCDSHLQIYGHNNIQFEDYIGKIIAIDEYHDLCIVTSNRNDGLQLAEKAAKPLDKIYLVGHPRGIGLTIREGRIIEEEYHATSWLDGRTVPWVQISTSAYPGNSGSPVTNQKGEVVGVLFAGHPFFHAEPFMVPHRYLKAFILKALLKVEPPKYAR